MAEIFRLPAVSPTMETGTIVAWRVPEGGAFASGDVLVEVATDKATVEAQVFEDGVLLARLADEDAEVPVGAPIAVIGQKGEDVTELVARARAEAGAPTSPAPTPAPAEPPPPAPAPAPGRAPLPGADVQAARAWQGRALDPSFLDPAAAVAIRTSRAAAGTAGVRASPLARRLAHERGVDLGSVRGSGRGGRIVAADLEVPASAPGAPARVDETLKLTPMRKVIAKRLLASHQDIPTFYLTATYDVGAWPTLKDAIKAARPDVTVSYNDLLLAAVARALVDFPAANASWTDRGIVRHGRVDLGLAVAVDEGLLTPVVRDADRLSLAELGARSRALAAKAREGALLPEEYQGATFTVSNLGMFDIEAFTAIINPPEAAILAAGSVRQVPVVQGGALAVGWRMNVTLTCDHRVLDGATGAQFLRVLRRYVEAPGLLVV